MAWHLMNCKGVSAGAAKIATEMGLTQGTVAMVVQKTLACLADELAQGRTIEFRDFGFSCSIFLNKNIYKTVPVKVEGEVF
jgi:hypothetical protein